MKKSFISDILSGILFIIIILFIINIIRLSIKENLQESKYHLKSLNIKEAIYGNFFLATGSIKTDIYYFAYIKTNKGIILKKFLRNVVFIFEDEINNPYLIIKETYKTDFIGDRYIIKKECIFHIPLNSIIENYSINLLNN